VTGDAKGGRGSCVHLSIAYQDEAFYIGRWETMGSEKARARRRLQRRKHELRPRLVTQDELHRSSAEIAYAVKDHDVGHLQPNG